MATSPKKGCFRYFFIFALILTGLCAVLVLVSALTNRIGPSASTVVDRLSEIDKFRLAEVVHLRQSLGDQVLPGWSQAEIPLILFNEKYIFLVGIENPPEGWRKVSSGTPMGQAWEVVPGDDFFGQPYYRQQYTGGQTTQAFTVQVGDDWAASLGTLEWMRIAMTDDLRQSLPPFLQFVAPYRLFVNLLLPNSDVQIAGVLHEAVHAYQGICAPEMLVEAELVYSGSAETYPEKDSDFAAAWQTELDLLNQALRAASQEEARELASTFLDQRAARRAAAHLSTNLVNLERRKEWEEGIAKYGEMSMYRLASMTGDYQPLPEMNRDPEFDYYRGAPRKWNQEIAQIRRMAKDEGDGRFYYSGFAQAVLLDRLSPNWKACLFDQDVWLEDLLAEALVSS